MSASARFALFMVSLGAVALAGSVRAHPELSHQLADAQAKVAAPGAGARDWWRAAELHRFRREWPAAEAAYARARALDGALAEVELDLARMRLEAGAPERALEALESYTERRRDDPEGWSVRGRALAALGRHDEATRAFAAALSLSVSTRPALPDDYLGWARSAEAGGTPIARVLAGLDAGARRLQGARSLEVTALDLAERHGLVPEALARVTQLEESARRKESWAARRARLLESSGREEEARAAWATVQRAIASLPVARRGDPAVRALAAEAAVGAGR